MRSRAATLALVLLLALPGGTTAASGSGLLFAAIPCAETPLGRSWEALRDEAARRFPTLALTEVEDLHLTLVYVGAWRPDDLAPLRELTRLLPGEAVTLTPEVATFGVRAEAVVIELLGAPPAWKEAVVAAQADLVRRELKAPDRWDGSFRPHVTLALARHRPPTGADRRALRAFGAWLARKIAADPSRFAVPVGPDSPAALWQTRAARASGTPAFAAVEAPEAAAP
ncbi:MAG: hypothetical protein GX178_03980 [Acidobacteria bacterium]|nr:2'-5' RNA ligase family protein [Thermoanaerobaculia bacterium]NLN10752.1 hypothetical protein [Acidobacteriota bacterium]MBP7812886.1 2'-5' RNA ligase family protein [Thermoanaerobaculia bacterium]MBP8844850.1 2'-5' RNA ligase family protein [Thermoanaerobaculia bacterium]HNZ96947.1 2'-5' RNA ligase family protein [Thermoanaerobaculia bacterium]